jgi:hypothetical protein
MIDGWEDLKEILTSNFQGTYVQPSNPWDLKSYWENWVNLSESTSDASPESATSYRG